MRQGINLINQEAQKSLRLQKLKESLKMTALGVVGVFILVSLIIFAIFLVIKQTYRGNETKISALKQQIKVLEKNESYAVIIANRIKGIGSIFKERKSYLEIVSEIEALSVPGFALESLEINAQGGLKISGSCETRESLTAFNEQVEQINQKKKYSQIVFPAVNRLSGGGYNVSLEFKI